MKISILNSNFTSLTCAVAYRVYRFIPSDIDSEKVATYFDDIKEGYEASTVKYYGSNESVIEGLSLLEYNFSQLVEKSKFNDNFHPSFLTNESKELVGRELGGIEQINKVLVPTRVDWETGEEEISKFDYFSSIALYTTLEQYLYFIGMLPGEWKLELYENPIIENLEGTGKFYDSEFLKLAGKEHTEPAIIIYLGAFSGTRIEMGGATVSYRYLPKSMYFHTDNGDPFTDSYYGPPATDTITLAEYKTLFEEVHDPKIVYLLFSPEEISEELRIFATVSKTDKNLNRNMPEDYLRNDEFWATRESLAVTKESSGLLLDRRSGTLLGTGFTKNHPILDRKLGRIEAEGDKWCRYRVYHLAERAIYDGNTWISLAEGNLGNNPKLSPAWGIYDPERDRLARISIGWDAYYSNQILPKGVIRVRGPYTFDYEPGPFYELSEETPITDGTIAFPSDLYVLNREAQTCTVNRWSWNDGEDHGPEITGKIKFKFVRKTVTLKWIALPEKGNAISYSGWINTQTAPGLSIARLETIPDDGTNPRFINVTEIDSDGYQTYPMGYGLKVTINTSISSGNNTNEIVGILISGERLPVERLDNNSFRINIPGSLLVEEDGGYISLGVMYNTISHFILTDLSECTDTLVFERTGISNLRNYENFKLRFYSVTEGWDQISDITRNFTITTYRVDSDGEIVVDPDGNPITKEGFLSMDIETNIFTYLLNQVTENYKIVFKRLT